MSLEYSNVVQTGDIFQFVPFPNGFMLNNNGEATILGNCKTGVPDCLYSSGYMVFGEASLTRTCVPATSSTVTLSGSTTTHENVPNGDCALSTKCTVHSTTTLVSSTTTVLKSTACTLSSSTSCTSTTTTATFTTGGKLLPCDESNWTAASVLHDWGDTNNYQKLDALENSWEVTANGPSGTPALAMKLSDVTDKFGDRSQNGQLLWLDTYAQETFGLNAPGSRYSIVPSPALTSTSKCTGFALGIPTSRGTLNGTIKVTPYIGTQCPTSSSPNPFVAYLSGVLTLTQGASKTSLTVSGVAVEFMCNRTILQTCFLPIPVTSSLTCVASVTVGQASKCTATVSNLAVSPFVSPSTVGPSGVVSFSSNSTGSLVQFATCTMLIPTITTVSGTCSVNFTPQTAGKFEILISYVGDSELVHVPPSGVTNASTSVTAT